MLTDFLRQPFDVVVSTLLAKSDNCKDISQVCEYCSYDHSDRSLGSAVFHTDFRVSVSNRYRRFFICSLQACRSHHFLLWVYWGYHDCIYCYARPQNRSSNHDYHPIQLWIHRMHDLLHLEYPHSVWPSSLLFYRLVNFFGSGWDFRRPLLSSVDRLWRQSIPVLCLWLLAS